MSLLKWKPMPFVPAEIARPGDRMWGAVRGRYSFVKTFISGHGWSVSWQDRSSLSPRTHRHPGNPFLTEAQAERAIEAEAHRLEQH